MRFPTILLVACVTAQATLSDEVEDLQFELLHPWNTSVEQPALNVIKSRAESRGIFWSDYAIDGHQSGIRKELVKRVSGGLSPTASLWFDGFKPSELLENQVIRSFKSDKIEAETYDFVWPQIRDLVYSRDEFNMVPFGIHALNVAIYNDEILQDLGADIPDSWQEFMDVASLANEAGYVPLAMSSQPWQLRYILQSMVIEEFTNQEIADLLKGDFPHGTIERLIPMFERLRKLQSYAGQKTSDRDWNDATRAVIEGRTLAQVFGDNIEPKVPDQGFTCVLSPGNTRVLWGVDALVFSKTYHRGERRAQELIISLLMEEETQLAYNKANGGLPVRRDLGELIAPGCFTGIFEGWAQESDVGIGQNLSFFWSSEFLVFEGVLHLYWAETEMPASRGVQIFLDAIEDKRCTD